MICMPAPEGNDFAKGNDGGGAPAGNDNAATHGMTSDTWKWFDRHEDEVGDDVREMVESWMELAPFGWAATGNVKLLTRAAINECQIEQGDEYIEEHGVIVDEPVTAGDGVIHKASENPAFRYKSRLQKDTIKILNKLGILDSPEMQHARNTQSVADAWRESLEAGPNSSE